MSSPEPAVPPRLVAPLPIDIGLDHRAGLDSGSLADDAVTLEADEDDARTVETAGDDARTVQAETDDPEAGRAGHPPERDADPERATRLRSGHDAGIAPSDGAAGGEDDGDGDAVDPKTLMATLIDAGALVDDGETLRLDESFRTAMYDGSPRSVAAPTRRSPSVQQRSPVPTPTARSTTDGYYSPVSATRG